MAGAHETGGREAAGGNAGMRLMLERRPEQSRTMTVASPLIAIAVTVVAGGIVFYARGLDPFHALYVYFIEPVMSVWSLEELVVKTAPLVLIGVGLAVCFRGEPLEHRRGGPARRGRARGCGDPGPRARVAVSGGAGADASPLASRAGWPGPRSPPSSATGSG